MKEIQDESFQQTEKFECSISTFKMSHCTDKYVLLNSAKRWKSFVFELLRG